MKQICECGHKKEKHDFAISKTDNIGKHCLGEDCNCKEFKLKKNKYGRKE